MKIPLRMWTFAPVESQALAEFMFKHMAPVGMNNTVPATLGEIQATIDRYLTALPNKLKIDVPEDEVSDAPGYAIKARLAVLHNVSDALNKGHGVKIEFAGEDDPTTPGGPALRVAYEPTRVMGDETEFVDCTFDESSIEIFERLRSATKEKLNPTRRPIQLTKVVEETEAEFCARGVDVCDKDCVPGGGICSAFTDCKNR